MGNLLALEICPAPSRWAACAQSLPNSFGLLGCLPRRMRCTDDGHPLTERRNGLMNARGIISGMLLIILGLLAGMGYLLFRSAYPVPGAVQVWIQTNTITQIGVRKINSTNYFLPPNFFRWSTIESTNYEHYIANLRSIDCPEPTIRDIIVADVAGLYARRRTDFLAQQKPAPFWKTVGAGEISAQQKQLRVLAEEQRQLIRQLLQVDLNVELDKYNLEAPAEPVDLSFLSAEKSTRVQAILEMFRQRQELLHEQATGLWSEADSEALQELNRQQESELSSLLTPEEMEDYEMRFSPLSSSMRGQLHGFNPSEEEFRKIFRLRRDHDETTVGLALVETDADPEELDQVALSHQQANTALEAELKSKLGTERFQIYQKIQEPNFQTLNRVAERFSLPAQVTNEAYEHIRLAQEQSQKLAADPSLDPSRREEALRAISEETQAAMSRILGNQAFPVFRGAISRDWLNFNR